MERTAIIYSFNTVKTGKIAEKIKETFASENIELINVEDITVEIFLSFNNLILGVPTWFDGELPNYWDEFVPDLEDMDLTGKKIAIFGLGDQKNYGENFIDGVGLMGNILEERGAVLVGFTSIIDYSFESSKAQREDKFIGLAIDFENQGLKNKERINQWVEQLKTEFS
jgi:flavodoxin I